MAENKLEQRRERRRANWRKYMKKRRLDPDYCAEIVRRRGEDRKNNPAKYLLQHAKRRAKVQGLLFGLVPADILIPRACPALGIPLDGRDRDHWPSIDRGIPTLGYVRGNVQVISYRANRIKNNATAAELAAVAKYAHRFCRG